MSTTRGCTLGVAHGHQYARRIYTTTGPATTTGGGTTAAFGAAFGFAFAFGSGAAAASGAGRGPARPTAVPFLAHLQWDLQRRSPQQEHGPRREIA